MMRKQQICQGDGGGGLYVVRSLGCCDGGNTKHLKVVRHVPRINKRGGGGGLYDTTTTKATFVLM